MINYFNIMYEDYPVRKGFKPFLYTYAYVEILDSRQLLTFRLKYKKDYTKIIKILKSNELMIKNINFLNLDNINVLNCCKLRYFNENTRKIKISFDLINTIEYTDRKEKIKRFLDE